jgi:hypothetical protein
MHIMKNKLLLTILIVLGIALGAMVVRAQTTTPAEGSSVGNYTMSMDADLGVRFLDHEGDFSKYRSDLNLGRGFRLFDFDFLVRSKNSNGALFDLFHVSALGWGGDPNQYVRIEVAKNKWYRFDSSFRDFAYFNNLTNLALNEHTADTRRKFGDFNLTLLPDNDKFHAYLGYTVDRNNGTAITTYDYQRDEFPILSPIRTVSNDYRIGFDAKVWVFDLSFLQGFRFFKDDTTFSVPSLNPGNNPSNASVITFLDRELPTRGRLPYTRFSLHTLLGKKLDFTGRYVYTYGTTRANMSEVVTGMDASANNILLDLFGASGTANRHNGMGDIGLSFFATDRLTISDTFRVNDYQISGSVPLSESLFESRTTPFGTTLLKPLFTNSFYSRFTGYRQFLNTIEADYKFTPRFSAHLGYRYTDRRVELGTLDPSATGLGSDTSSETQKNHTNSIFAGFKARPVTIWTVFFDFERGTSDNVFTRVANYDFTNFRVRNIIKPTKSLSINTSLVTKDNDNPSLTDQGQNFGVNIKSRIFTSSVDWTPNSKFTFSGGYTLNRVDSVADVIFYLSGIPTAGQSLYFLRDNFFFFNTRVQFHPRASFYVGYRINKDLGQGDRKPTSTAILISSYPLHFLTPEARLTVRLQQHVDWNAGWQYYDYNEKFLSNQDYRANTGYTSLRFSF